MHNIDPVVLVDDDNRVFVYWGSFNQLRGVELGSDMTTIIGSITAVISLTGFFEAPWFMKRKETYYMLYAANNAGPDSPCTPTSYHACIAYGTASSPLGPWTFRGVILPIVSSTTSHPGVYALADGAHFLVYHTADAEGGGHFRRSIALDPLLFDDAANPPSIRPVERSVRPALSAPRPPSRNVAPLAEPSSVPRTPVQYWLAALHDERVPSTPLPPDYCITAVISLTGFFEAPWFMKRKETYYMLYAANNAGPDSPCTPTSYHACIAYGTASSPLGPWTFRGVVLPIVSSTTSHPGVYALADGAHFLVYHTADAEGGGHFRRSIALDPLLFDDAANPPSIRPVERSVRPALSAPRPPSRNVAPLAEPSSVPRTPVQYWLAALHDERVPSTPLPPDYWSAWAGEASPRESVLTYTWNATVELNGVAVAFFADAPAGSDFGVAPPREWRVEYRAADGAWKDVAAEGPYPNEVTDSPAEVGFATVKTTMLRAAFVGSGNGPYAAVGIKECTTSHPGVYALADGAHFLVYHTADAEGGGHFRRSIALDPLLFDDATNPPSIRPVERSVRPALSAPRPPSRNVAPLAEPSSVPRTPVQYWLAALHDERVPSTPLPPDYWSAWAGEASPRESVLTYTWNATVELNGVAVAFFADAPAGSDFGVAPPREWRVEYRAADGAWKDVAAEGPYPNEVTDSPAERVPSTPLPPDYWSAWAGEASPRESVLTYTWNATVELNGVAVAFFADAPAGADFGVAPPREWRVEYRAADGAWKDVAAEGPYPNEVTDSPAEVGFATVKTTMLRAAFVGSGNGPYAAVGIKEWFAFAPAPV
ncbi:hypothetical protein BN1708_001357 [Verticillium longisporum]|uniref:F5/8 type C domain-containing protein n=1 Tax=Verticillium longisporum TaxID=100787 RepID=A0A0G4MNH7_VERLO|nr:hypothetical protein BN1708_001357 [Verticillium longisporum]